MSILINTDYLDRLKKMLETEEFSEDSLLSIIFTSQNKDIVKMCIRHKNLTIESLKDLKKRFKCELVKIVDEVLCERTGSFKHLR